MSQLLMADYLGFTPEDQDDVVTLLADPTFEADAKRAKLALAEVLGTYREPNFDALDIAPLAWLRAFVELTPTLVGWHRQNGVPDEIIRATFVDLGRNVAIHRRSHHEFGMETWSWLLPHYTGMMFAIGRINYALHHPVRPLPGVAPDAWVVGMHIPETGPLDDAAVTSSLSDALNFFRAHFPSKPIRAAVCETWLLDAELLKSLPAQSNIKAFGNRFEIVGEPEVDATVALFFLFRTRDLEQLPSLPKPTSLQRLVVDRLRSSEPWTVATGMIRFDGSR